MTLRSNDATLTANSCALYISTNNDLRRVLGSFFYGLYFYFPSVIGGFNDLYYSHFC